MYVLRFLAPFSTIHPVLVHSGCYEKKNTIDSDLNNKDLFLIILGAGKSKIKELEDLVSGETWLPGS